jgi:hypothetical protein
MTVQNETKWLLQIIQENYPAAEWPDNLVRRNRDDLVTLDAPYSPRKEEGVELTLYNVVSVSTGSTNREFYGQDAQYSVEHELDVRVEGLDERKSGEIASDDEFKTLVAYVRKAIDDERVYPAVDTGDEDIGRVSYKDMGIVNSQNLSSNAKDHFREDMTVRMRGDLDP